MKTRRKWLTVAVLLLCVSAAAAVGVSVNEPTKSLEMKVGEEKAPAGADFTLLLAGVPEDSRCPEGVNCIWAGTVGVELVFCGPKAERTARLNTATPPRVLKYRGQYIRILGVSPRKIEGREIKPSDYVVTLDISKDRPAAEGESDIVEIKDE
jgi:hypothetical protein